ncbi:MAG: RES family NAD+ phosphorylase [Candidatus Thiodiazotropha sp.]
MRVWRVCREPYTGLDGRGAELKGGRWNSPGRPVVYTSAHLSLAILEVLVHLEVDVEDLPDDYVSVEIDIPDAVKTEIIAGNFDTRSITMTRDRGDDWLNATGSAVLNVPSVVVPKERNLCINPRHDDFQQIRTLDIQPFRFDPRLFEQG